VRLTTRRARRLAKRARASCATSPPAPSDRGRLRPTSTSTWHLFLDGELPVQIESAAGDALPVTIAPTPRACDGISHRATFDVVGP
jgi:hypothetical protein